MKLIGYNHQPLRITELLIIFWRSDI